jgi:hypothetical protein
MVSVERQGSDCALKSLMASKSLFGHHLLGKSLNVLACVGPPGPTNTIQWLMGYFPAQTLPEDFKMQRTWQHFAELGPP